eukprot:TRINITY_DN9998_c0_g1_i1.p1 TRINITY_DN9998_c0_g1~~TRINITY_DN9998_c0_g1_i1.p1  ORF type:complete len:816 (-),score=194.29 TRINITY_DN9998_c0_g1_i1:77-2524(-)
MQSNCVFKIFIIIFIFNVTFDQVDSLKQQIVTWEAQPSNKNVEDLEDGLDVEDSLYNDRVYYDYVFNWDGGVPGIPCNCALNTTQQQNYACNALIYTGHESRPGMWKSGIQEFIFDPSLSSKQVVTQVNVTLHGRFSCGNASDNGNPNVFSVYVEETLLQQQFAYPICSNCGYCSECESCMVPLLIQGPYIPTGYPNWDYNDHSDILILVSNGAICLGKTLVAALVEEYEPSEDTPILTDLFPNRTYSKAVIRFIGTGFNGTDNIMCKFGDYNVTQALFINTNSVFCQVPEFKDPTIHQQKVSASNDGILWSNELLLGYIWDLEISTLKPTQGKTQQETEIELDVVAQFTLTESSVVLCQFGNMTGTRVWVVATWATPSNFSDGAYRYLCNAPSVQFPVNVTISMSADNGTNWAFAGNFRYYTGDTPSDNFLDGLPWWVVGLIVVVGICVIFMLVVILTFMFYTKMKLSKARAEYLSLTSPVNGDGYGATGYNKGRPIGGKYDGNGRASGFGSYMSSSDINDSWELDYAELELDTPGGLPDYLGRGAYGIVVKGRYRGTTVAIKSFVSEAAKAGSDSEELFRKEMDILSGLHHPNVVLLIGATLHPRTMVTEYVEQGSIRDITLKDPDSITWKRVIKISYKSALGMNYLHGRGILHRDLKGANILIDKHWNAKICDFGLSRPVALHTMTGHTGTLRWIAPECLGESLHYSKKVDVYSYGMVLYELISKKVPFEELGFDYLVEKALKQGQRPVVPSTCNSTYADLMMACWSENPDDRPDFEAVIKILVNLKASEGKKGKDENDDLESVGTSTSNYS